MVKHTPTPWHCDPAEYDLYVWGPEGEMVLELRGHGAGLPKRAEPPANILPNFEKRGNAAASTKLMGKADYARIATPMRT